MRLRVNLLTTDAVHVNVAVPGLWRTQPAGAARTAASIRCIKLAGQAWCIGAHAAILSSERIARGSIRVSQLSHSDGRSHRVLLARRKFHRTSKHVAGLDTDELLPFVISQIRQQLRTLSPWVPNNRIE